MPMRRSNLLIAFYLVLIFASGILMGAFATRLLNTKAVSAKETPTRLTPEEWRRQYTTEMQTRLSLNPEQMTRLNEILDATGSKVHDERERHNQAMKAIHDGQVGQTRLILTDAQRGEYEKLRKEREERAKAERARRDRAGR